MWIARNEDNELFLYINKPIKYEGKSYFLSDTQGEFKNFFLSGGLEQDVQICSTLYPEVTWENSPKELIIKD